jgi:hypothetical protein
MAAGSRGRKRFIPKRSTSAAPPTARVGAAQLPTSRRVWTTIATVFPDGFSIPTSFGN